MPSALRRALEALQSDLEAGTRERRALLAEHGPREMRKARGAAREWVRAAELRDPAARARRHEALRDRLKYERRRARQVLAALVRRADPRRFLAQAPALRSRLSHVEAEVHALPDRHPVRTAWRRLDPHPGFSPDRATFNRDGLAALREALESLPPAPEETDAAPEIEGDQLWIAGVPHVVSDDEAETLALFASEARAWTYAELKRALTKPTRPDPRPHRILGSLKRRFDSLKVRLPGKGTKTGYFVRVKTRPRH